MFLEICTQIHSVVFALNRQINKQTCAKTINLLCKGNTIFVNIKLKGGLTPNPPLCTSLVQATLCFRMLLLKPVWSAGKQLKILVLARKASLIAQRG